ncbi:MAG: hypothetical protein IPJ76_09535 [Flavobacteriales bacterium]|nr:MAG: hypothetical protein IPJ76_09535 [Flavobacteriales bacterium]
MKAPTRPAGMARRAFLGIVAVVLFGSFHQQEELAIEPGFGIRGVVELGWTKKQLFDTIGRTKERRIKSRDCVRWTEHRLDYPSRGIYADLDRDASFDTTPRTDRLIDYLSFDTASHASVRGLRIGIATRAEVYDLFGVDPTYRHSFSLVTHNPSSSYDTLGVDFVFDCDLRDLDPLNERLIQVDIYAPRVH